MNGTSTTFADVLDPVAAVNEAVDRFTTLRRRARNGILVEAAGALLLLLAGYALLTFVIDRNLRLEWPFRCVLLAAFLFVALRSTWRRLAPLGVRLDDDEMALAVERQAPALRQALISALQFGRALAGGGRIVESRELMAAVVTDVRGRLGSLPFGAAIDATRVRKYGALAGACLLAFAGWGIVDGQSLGIWAARNLGLASIEWPRYTQLRFLGTDDNVVRLPQGDPYTVRIGVGGPVPDQVFLRYAFASGEDGVEPMSRTGDGEFTLTLEALLEDCELVAEGGDGLTEPPLKIAIVERPRIEDVKMQVVFPDYMHKEPELLPPTEGEVRIVRGSGLVLGGRSHKPIREAFALLGDQKQPLERDADGHSFRGSLAPKAGALLELNVIDEDQLGAGAPPRLLIRIVEDRPPTIDLKLRGISSLISFKARVPGDLKVKDDFGVTRVGAGVRVVDDQAVVAQPPRPGQQPEAQPEPAFDPVEVIYGDALQPGAVRYETTASIDLKQLNAQPEKEDAPENKVRPGMLLSLRHSARDNYGPGDPHETRGEVLTFRVVTIEKLLEELRRRQVEQRQEAERILDEERMAMIEVRENYVDEHGNRAKARYKALARQQQALGRRVAFIGDIYQRILWEFENNRVMDPSKIRELEGLITVPLEALAREPFPATARQVAAFADSGEDPVRAAALDGYADIITRLEAIVKVMEQAETLAALLEQLKGVIKTEDEATRNVEERLREAGKRVFGTGRDTPKDPNNRK